MKSLSISAGRSSDGIVPRPCPYESRRIEHTVRNTLLRLEKEEEEEVGEGNRTSRREEGDGMNGSVRYCERDMFIIVYIYFQRGESSIYMGIMMMMTMMSRSGTKTGNQRTLSLCLNMVII